MLDRVGHVMRKEFLQILRDPRMRAVVFVVPVVQLIVFGYAVNMDVKDVPAAVMDRDASSHSRELCDMVGSSGRFVVEGGLSDMAAVRGALDSGAVKAVFRIEHGFEGDVLAGRRASAQLILDGSDTTTASIAASHASAIAERFGAEKNSRRIARLSGAKPRAGVRFEPRAWFNENLESRNFFIPGVVGLLVTLVTLMLTGMAVVREKEIGTMEQIMVSPIRPYEFILGKTLPFALIGMLDVVIVLAVAVSWFDVPVRGSIPLLFLCMGFYVMSTLGIGLLISTVCSTQQQAMMTTFFFFMPAMLLSGFAFPIENMPDVIQVITYLNPMRYLFVILRGLFLKGVGFQVLWPQIAALAAIGVVTLVLSSMRFRKTMP